MDCKEINELFASYLDGELTPTEKEQIQQHLDVCPLCREELDELSLAQTKLQQTLSVAAESVKRSEKTWERIKKAIEADKPTPVDSKWQPIIISLGSRFKSLFFLRPIWKPIALGALVIAVVVSLVVILPPMFGNDIIARAYSSMERIKSYNFYVSNTSLDLQTGLMVNTYSEGIFSTPNSWQMRVTRDTAPEDGWQIRDIIVLGEKGYLRSDDGDWSTVTFPENVFQIPKPIDDLEMLKDMQIRSTSLVRGVACTHLVGTIDLSKSSSRLLEAHEDVIITFEIWIGEEDSLLRRGKISLQFLKEPLEIFGSGIILVSEMREYYNYSDQPINILPPITS